MKTLQPPPASVFQEQDADFLEAGAVSERAERLIDEYPELHFLGTAPIAYLWKRKGGATAGRATLGKCVLSSGLMRHFSNTAWVIWIAADHVREMELTDEQVEALIYHELLHCTTTGEDERPAVKGHDFEAFRSEIRRYGAWKLDLKSAADAFHQLPLPVEAA